MDYHGFLQDLFAVAELNSHLTKSICGSLLDKENESQGIRSQQSPLLPDKLSNMKSTTPHQWCECYKTACEVNKSADFLRAALSLPSTLFMSEQSQRKCVLAIYCEVIKTVQQDGMSSTVAKDNVSALLHGVEDLHADDVPAIIEAVYSPLIHVETVQGNGMLYPIDLLPLLISIVSKKIAHLVPNSQLRCDVSGMNGASYVEHIVVEICRLQWPTGWHIKLVECFKEMNLSPSLLGVVVAKCVKQLDLVAVEELPALTYQLLLLGSQRNGAHRELIVVKVLERFNSLDPMDLEETHVLSAASSNDHIRAVVGNVVQFFNFASTQDHGLGSTLLKSIQGDDKIDTGFSWLRLTPFAATLALSIMQTQRFQQKVVDMFIKLVADGSKHHCRLNNSAWLTSHGSSPSPSAGSSGRGSHGGHVSWVLSRVVASNCGWDRITPALVQLGMAFIDKAPSTDSFVALLENSSTVMADVGVSLLKQIYITNASARDTILSKILERMLTRGGGVRHVLLLLEELVMRCPLDLLQQGNALKEMFSFLAEIKPLHSEELLRMCCPLFILQPSFADMAMLPLRKSLFSRSEATRVMAASGLINLLSVAGVTLKEQAGKGHQLSQSLHDEGAHSLSVEEIMTLLRRCLTQQCAVRRMVYSGLTDCFQNHPILRRHIYGFISGHLRRYMVMNKGQMQFDLDSCIGSSPLPHVNEPLGYLVTCVSRIVCLDQVESSDSLKQDLVSIAKQLETIDLSDYLDNPQDFAQAQGDRDQCRIILLKSALEACMIHSVNCGVTEPSLTSTSVLSEDVLISVVTLYKHYEVLPTLMEALNTEKKAASTSSKSKKEDGFDAENDESSMRRQTCFSLESIVPLLQSLAELGEPESQMEVSQADGGYTKSKDSLHCFLLQVATAELALSSSLSQRRELGQTGQFIDQTNTSDLNLSVLTSAESIRYVAGALGPLLFKAYKIAKEELREEEESGAGTQKGKGVKSKEKSGCSISEVALLGFLHSIKLMVASARVISTQESSTQRKAELDVFNDILGEFVWNCFSSEPNNGDQNSLSVIAKGVKSLIKHVSQYCESTVRVALSQRLALGALECVVAFTSAVPASQLNGVSKKMTELCKERSAPSTRLCQELSRGFVACHGGPYAPSLAFLSQLSEAVLAEVGPQGEDSPVTECSSFQLLKDKEELHVGGGKKMSMGSVVAEVVSETLDQSIKDVEYLLIILKRLPKPSEKQKAPCEDVEGVEEEATSVAADSEERNNCDKICDRLVEIMNSILPLCRSKLDTGKYFERILTVFRKVYDSIGKLVKFLIDHKTLWLSQATKAMLGLSAEMFTPNVYQFIQYTMECGQLDRVQLASQGRLVPLIIERMEFVDLQLVTLDRMCVKTDDVHSFIVRSSARDFKIDLSALQHAQKMAGDKEKRKKEQKVNKDKKKKSKKNTPAEDEEIVTQDEEEEEEED